MAILRICTWGDPRLKAKAQPVLQVTDAVRQLAQDLFDTLRAENGVGLAATQVGANLRLFVVEVPSPVGEPVRLALINPELVKKSKAKEAQEEGCLSFPGIWGPVERHLEVEVRGTDLDGRTVSLQGAGLLARAFQHELDHLDGTVFVDRMKLVQRTLLGRQLRELAKQTKATLAGHGISKL